ncbi:MAG: cupin domain-containing protein [Candidatus Devosia phytovorans]|uniref:Cupin domain-containing protein n=1 Tax=Candidatus Devosia phytovorans TaxID=3121372 RepID=A0AAJ5VYZ0_9HYPH|nr:cupin domain-containing protein [Devosia sp.]WEK06093.1 MAG: cupin domain-containing protein [Devosia sp.]
MRTEQHWSKPNGMLPNSRLPLLVHRNAVPGGGEESVMARLRSNGWLNNWRYPGIYTYHHFHSTTHECLGCARGRMEVVLFGEGGVTVRVEAGDIIVLPAGVSHCMTEKSGDIQMVGGYPDGRDWDNCQQDKLTIDLHREAAKRIMMLPIPPRDPATGEVMQHWIDAPSSVDADLNDYRDSLG